MTFKLIKNTSSHNKRDDIDNDLKNVPCQKRKHLCNDPNNNLIVMT